jgi:hypothetical protein
VSRRGRPRGSGDGGWDRDLQNHWRSDVVTVGYETPDDDREYEPMLREALSYWTEHSEQYAGFDVAFRLVEPGERADVVVRFVETVSGCSDGSGDPAVGCAPVLTDTQQIDRPIEVETRTGLSRSSTVQVLKHELGHTLGIEHGAEPRPVMDEHTALEATPKPNATERALSWRSDDLVVYTDLSALPASQRGGVERQIGAALYYYMDGANGTVPENVTFLTTDRPESADIVIEYTDADACRPNPGSCGTVGGEDLDGDGALDYYTRLDVVLVDLDPTAVAWHVARWLGTGFGQETDEAYPEPLRGNASYEDRRSPWWD